MDRQKILVKRTYFGPSKNFGQKEPNFVQKKSYRIKIIIGENPYKCVKCSTDFKQKPALIIHGRIHTGDLH